MLWRAQYQDVDMVYIHAFRELANTVFEFRAGGVLLRRTCISRRGSKSWPTEIDTARIPHGNPVATIS